MTDPKQASLAWEYRRRVEDEGGGEGRDRACLYAVVAARRAWVPYVVLAVQFGADVVAGLVADGMLARWDVDLRTEDDPVPRNRKTRLDRRVTLTPLAAERLHVELDEVIVVTPDGPSDEAFWSNRVEIGSREDVPRPIVLPRLARECRLPPFPDLIPDKGLTIGGKDRAHEPRTRRERRKARRAG